MADTRRCKVYSSLIDCRILHEYLYTYVYKKGTVFRQTYPLFKSLAMRSRRSGSWALENIILNTAVFKYTNPLKHKIYRYIMPGACDFFNGWWRDSSSLIVHHDSHFVYRFVWFKCIFKCFQCFF